MNIELLQEQLGAERIAAFQKAFALSGNSSLRERKRHLKFARNDYQGQDESLAMLDEWLVQRVARIQSKINEIKSELHETKERLCAPPNIPGVYLSSVNGRALVSVEGRGQRVVELQETGLSELQPGDGVVLSSELNVVLGKLPASTTGRHIGRFERASKGQAVISHRSEEVLCSVVNGLEVKSLKPGDQIVIDPGNRLAIEKVEDEVDKLPYELEEVTELAHEEIAGLDAQVEQVLGTLSINLEPGLSDRYRLNGPSSILLWGPPGTGKSSLARKAVETLRQNSDHRVRFVLVRPSEFKSKYVGESERRIRDCFDAIRQVSQSADKSEHVLLYFDEAEALGRTRGTSGVNSFIDDSTSAILAELDGVRGLQNVSIVSSCNRPDLLDPALRERIGGQAIAVPRPNLTAAKSILNVHLRAEDPWIDESAREEAIDAAIGLLFTGESSQVCRIGFNDSSTRIVTARELISGRILSGIATNARRLAARREVERGNPNGGLEINDVLTCTEDAMDSLRTSLSKQNVHSHLTDLKQDLAVVSVEPINPRPRRVHNYLNS